jgi:hypothetical protein
MSGLCRDCRWWIHQPTQHVFGACERAAVMANFKVVHEDSMAWARPDTNGDDIGADLWTSPLFGCVQFEPIVAAPPQPG